MRYESHPSHLSHARAGNRLFVVVERAAADAANPGGAAGRDPCGARRRTWRASVKSPDVAADGRVTFRLRAPNAKEVAVAMGGKRLPMQKDDQGVWSQTTDPCRRTSTPIRSRRRCGDERPGQSPGADVVRQLPVDVRRARPQPWLPAAGVPHGAVTRHAFHSAMANDDRDFFVYTPAGYDARRSQAYPVLYLLHGLGDDAERWVNSGGGANNILDNLIAQGKAVPMVMVTTLGYGRRRGRPAAGPENMTGYAKILLDEVMPIVDKAYNVSKNREERAIAGLSMGGAETLYIGLNHLDKFAWMGAFSRRRCCFRQRRARHHRREQAAAAALLR